MNEQESVNDSEQNNNCIIAETKTIKKNTNKSIRVKMNILLMNYILVHHWTQSLKLRDEIKREFT